MSKYNITSLNYVSTGLQRTFINLDLSGSGGISSNMTFVHENPAANDRNEKFNRLYTTGLVIDPMYDMIDVALKSDTMQTNARLVKFDKSSRTEDMYLPQLSSNIVQFCQLNDKTYILTPSISKSEMNIHTSFEENSANNNSNFFVQLSGADQKTILYKSCDELGASSYKEYLSDGGTVESIMSNCKAIDGIEYNYLVKVDNNKDCVDVIDGNEYGEIYQLKNMYDSTYSMHMDSSDQIDNCRQYIGVGVAGDTIYLKYLDNVDYKLQPSTNGINAIKSNDTKYSYQKIETFHPNEFKSTALHKSNYYSIRIKNTGLYSDESSSDKTTRENIDKIKKDIKNTIQEICRNVAPVNTQLVDVIFED